MEKILDELADSELFVASNSIISFVVVVVVVEIVVAAVGGALVLVLISILVSSLIFDFCLIAIETKGIARTHKFTVSTCTTRPSLFDILRVRSSF